MPKQTPWEISPSDFWDAYACYEKHVPGGLKELESFRTEELPQKLAQSIKANKDIHLSQEEIVKLMEWKLKHGQFRPQLLSLIRKNDDQEVKETTGSAFRIYLADREDWRAALKELCKLKGVGVATGALILSTLDPQHAPFFSDELFRWLHWDEQTKPGQPKGWERKISYVEKEYVSLVEKLKRFENERWSSIESTKEDVGEFNALAVEKVAYVFGKESVYVGDDSELPVTEEVEGWSTEGAENPTQGKTRAGSKRKSATTDVGKDDQVQPKRARGKAKIDAELDIPNLTPSQITPLEIGKLVARYQERQMSPELRVLENYCLGELIKDLQIRKGKGGSKGGFMTSEELTKLTNWKININPDEYAYVYP
ncbi:uncharacterized protein K452DRAFT_226785 [Aplosporella prunicola CBS 121167]|uniref:Uncharacterized protein n=1 Tax=Aplosporella prunicola CBS 121167 TaxID=1176127 RepID=A0A6A6BDY7_9PEZI|nr:uncharacterized protein K452DRAFT_226785 [Aplosporella prunicola CBS 121167]KAF2142380.1 hypothetical protein K452DRAFT_226785 [Aplosporella prunicola CBS 121167]